MAIVRLALSLTLVALVACNVDGSGEPPPGEPPPGDPPPVEPPPPTSDTTLSGDITESASYAGAVVLEANATIKAGVDVFLEAGTVLTAADQATLTVEGRLIVNGTAESMVSITPVEGAFNWTGIVAESGSSVSINYATGTDVATLLNCRAGAAQCAITGTDFQGVGKVLVAGATATIDKSRFVDMSNGAVSIATGSDVTITDSILMTSSHDIIVISGGSLTMDYSEIGGAQGSYEHCNIHIGSSSSVTITNSNIISAIYGMMIGGTTNARINNNNFIGNDAGQDISKVGTVSNIDLTQNYWDQTNPNPGPEFDTSNPIAQEIAEAGPRIAF